MGYCLARDEGLRGEVEALISEVLESERVRGAYEAWGRAERERSEAEEEYENAMLELWDRVRHGEPLRGYCGKCPKTTIGR